ncbi:MAG TPA: TlyA family RNA methyltransferase [Acidimicrobiia bacterium]|nr:TlyA family RNA methyltransferase [Acidimicrobiia bacterium]
MSRSRLDAEMVRRGLVPSRVEAKRLLEEGNVIVTGVPTPKPATLITRDTPVSLLSPGHRYVSRGALKLIGALDAIDVAVEGKRALDAGASTGGFTEVLLERGATEVVALDVGRAQLHERLRRDPRVTVMERTNLRHTGPEETGGRFPLIVADLSFISLCTVAPALADLSEPGADLVLLVKPQFEAGKGEVGSGGIVRDGQVRRRAIENAVSCLNGHGLGAQALVASPITGAGGNREVFVWCRQGAPARHLEIPE